MPEFIALMHILPDGMKEGDWGPWLDKLRQSGRLRGGSEIGDGKIFSKRANPATLTSPINGFVRIVAADLNEAGELLSGNPVFEAGGAVEIRHLPTSD